MIKSWVSQNQLLIRCKVNLHLWIPLLSAQALIPWAGYSVGGRCAASFLRHGQVDVHTGERWRKVLY